MTALAAIDFKATVYSVFPLLQSYEMINGYFLLPRYFAPVSFLVCIVASVELYDVAEVIIHILSEEDKSEFLSFLSRSCSSVL